MFSRIQCRKYFFEFFPLLIRYPKHSSHMRNEKEKVAHKFDKSHPYILEMRKFPSNFPQQTLPKFNTLPLKASFNSFITQKSLNVHVVWEGGTTSQTHRLRLSNKRHILLAFVHFQTVFDFTVWFYVFFFFVKEGFRGTPSVNRKYIYEQESGRYCAIYCIWCQMW